MRNLSREAEDFNTLATFLARRDVPVLTAKTLQGACGTARADLLLLMGGSIPHGCRFAGQLYRAGLAKRMMTIGGVGHTTAAFCAQMQRVFPQLDTAEKPEGALMRDYLALAFEIPAKEILVESSSTNCGENVRFAREILEKEGRMPKTAIVLHDSTMQRRMGATMEKEWADFGVTCVHYASYTVKLIPCGDTLRFEPNNILGLWEPEHYMSLLLSEIPRLRDDAQGYGPRGCGFLAHVEVPQAVLDAYERLCPVYAPLLRAGAQKK
ncbi:MAG: YdcF family protein [Ruthenibacterium sp.]